MNMHFVMTALSSTFVCPTEILAFNDRLAEFKKINAEVTLINAFEFFEQFFFAFI